MKPAADCIAIMRHTYPCTYPDSFGITDESAHRSTTSRETDSNIIDLRCFRKSWGVISGEWRGPFRNCYSAPYRENRRSTADGQLQSHLLVPRHVPILCVSLFLAAAYPILCDKASELGSRGIWVQSNWIPLSHLVYS